MRLSKDKVKRLSKILGNALDELKDSYDDIEVRKLSGDIYSIREKIVMDYAVEKYGLKLE